MTPDIISYRQAPTSSAIKTNLPPAHPSTLSWPSWEVDVHLLMVGTWKVPLSASSATEL